MLVKEYGNSDDGKQAHRRYSPGQVNGMEITVVTGSPDLDKVSTSYAERSNLTLRMSMRRFTPPDQRILKEDQQSCLNGVALLRVLQFLPSA